MQAQIYELLAVAAPRVRALVTERIGVGINVVTVLVRRKEKEEKRKKSLRKQRLAGKTTNIGFFRLFSPLF
jgi:hypothetical protein